MIHSKTRVSKNALNGRVQVLKQRRSTAEVDHWAFLEEIEAPMWADLTLESKLMSEDVDDHWFKTTHKFHQCSARQLRSEFSHSRETSGFFDFNIRGVSSPKLPSSVSNSRGKKHKSRKWVEDVQLSANKVHPVKNLDSRNSSSDKGVIHEGKTKISFGNTRRIFGSKSTLTSDNGFSGKHSNSSGLLSRDGTKGVRSVSVSAKDSHVTGNITTESNPSQDPKDSDSSKQAFNQPRGLLSTLKMNMRKSHATRPALRVEINENRGSNGCKSSTGNSSVGSSSYPGSGVKNTAQVIDRNENKTPESRNIVNIKQFASRKLQISVVTKPSTIRSRNVDGNKSKLEGKVSGGKVELGSRNPVNRKQPATKKPQVSIVAKASTILSQNLDGKKSKAGGKSDCGKLESVKPRVPLHTLQKKGSNPIQVHAKGKSVLNKAMAGLGTENATRMVSKNSDFKENMAAEIRGLPGKQLNIGNKGEGTMFIGSKGKMIGRSDGRHVLKAQKAPFK